MKFRSFNLLIVLALLLSLLGSAVTVTPAFAAGIVVNSNADDTLVNLNGNGTCDLREAITNANGDNQSGSTECTAGAGADIITFAADYTITLSSQLPAVTTPITITGNGATKTIIQASTCNPVTLPGGCTPVNYRVFEVGGSGDLKIDKITVRHGRRGNFFLGGGIYSSGALTITDSIISGNDAGNGGGIYNEGAKLSVLNTTISDNHAYNNGGGIQTNGPATLTNSIISGNICDGSCGGGGGIINNSSTLTITNSVISNNQTSAAGGGIFTVGGSLTVSKSTITGNSAGFGGGIQNNTQVLSIENSTISTNNANDGGGMYNFGSSSPMLTNVTFSNNSASTNGGGMYNNISNPMLTNVTFSGNSATSGGGMHNTSGSSPMLTNVTFSGNSASSGGGGGMYNESNSSPTLTNVTFSGNSASINGGGMLNFNNSRPTLTNVTFSGNKASTNSGGVPILKNVIIANSTGDNCFGGVDTSSSNNLINDNTCLGVTDGNQGNKIGAYTVNLGSLANNGGFTQTHALTTGSAAIDAGANCAATDQRGVTRPQGAGCDIGAHAQ